ncbi:N-acyl homoserine lactonase QqlR [Spirosoma arcticum]
MQQTGRYAAATLVATQLTQRVMAQSPRSPKYNPPTMSLTSPHSEKSVHTTTVLKNGQPVKIHAISTGSVAVTQSFRRAKGGELFRKANILLDSHFTEFMPIWVWVIEHPEGVLVIDTGETSDVLKPDYFDKTGKINRFVNKKAFRFAIGREQEIDRQLVQLGITPDRIRRVVMTHLHLDHTDGLRYFPKTEIVVARPEFERPYSNLPELYPSWFKPHLVDYKTDQIAGFSQSAPLTDAGDVLLVATPGHTHHHSSVLFQADDVHYLFAGDMSYNQGQLLRGELAGGNANQHQARQSYQQVLAYAAQHPLVYLPSHDADAANRLGNQLVVPTAV